MASSSQLVPRFAEFFSQPELPKASSDPLVLQSGSVKEKNGSWVVTVHDGEYHISAKFDPSVEVPKDLEEGSMLELTSYEFIYNTFSAVKPVELLILDYKVVPGRAELLGAPSKLRRDEFEALRKAGELKQTASSSSSSSAKKTNNRPDGVVGIEALSPYNSSAAWKIRARVMQKSDVRTFQRKSRDGDGGGQGKLFNVTFVDETGEIRATGFEEAVDKFYDELRDGSVYYVSKCDVRAANKRFNTTNNDFELMFGRDTEITPCFEDVKVPEISFSFVDSFANLINYQKDSNVDVVGVISSVGPVDQLTSKTTNQPYSKRDIVLTDTSGYAVRTTIWGDQATKFNEEVGTVLAIKGCRVSDFDGRSLSLLRTSIIQVNPVEVRQAHSIKGWWDDEGRKQQLNPMRQQSHDVVDNGVAGDSNAAKNLPKTIKEVYDEELGRSDTPDYFTLKARISHIFQRTMTYAACPSGDCFKKVIEVADGWRCEKCNKTYDSPTYRFILTVVVGDDTAGEQGLTLSLFDEVGSQVLGKTGNEINEIQMENPDSVREVLNSVIGDEYSWRIKARQDIYNEEVRVRYQALQAVSTKKEVFKLTDALLTEMGY